MVRKKIFSIIIFYLLVYLIIYIVNPLLFSHLEILYIPLRLLINHILILVGIFLIAHAVLRLNNENRILLTLGIRKHNLGNSFLWATALSTPISLFWIIGTWVSGVSKMLTIAKPSWINPPISSIVLLYSVSFWILSGVMVVMFWESFPYEFMRDFPKKFVIPLIIALWAGLYNTPLITGKFDPFDIIFFGFLFVMVYHKTRNSVGILMAYLLNENPLWWVITAAFGPNTERVFVVFLIFRLLVCLLSILWIIKVKILFRKGV